MTAALKYLSRILNEELNHTKIISDFLQQKENALIHNDGLLFKELIMKEQNLVIKSRELEKSRLTLMNTVAQNLQIIEPKLSLTKLLSRLMDSPLKDSLNQVGINLKTMLIRVQTQNKKCEILLKKTMDMVQFSIGLVTGQNQNKQKMVYGQDMKYQREVPKKVLLDQRG